MDHDPFPLRIVNGYLRWHRLRHRTLGVQVGGSPDLARLLDLQSRLAQDGIETDVVSEWLPWEPPPHTPGR